MLTRLYIDNFRCFEKFEWKPGRKQLILGRNGTGKTSLADAVSLILQITAIGQRVHKWFELSDRTRWLDQRMQTFEIGAQLASGDYDYRLQLEPSGKQSRPCVQHESVRLDGKPLVSFEHGRVIIYSPDGSVVSSYKLAQSSSVLSTMSPEDNPNLIEFRDWLTKTSYWHLNPFDMDSRAENDDEVLADTGFANFATWYRQAEQMYPEKKAAFLQDLRESLDGFKQLRLEDAGETVQILYAEFSRQKKSTKILFDELSDGQRCLICLYAIMHFVVARGGTAIIDEPDNFISLREIQPWLMSIEEIADDHDGQVILISHHPEILNQWAGPYGVQFIRDGAGPVRVEKFKGDPGSSLSVAELVARGWDLD
jgi:predicted ATPase